jgi:integral membrane sensor domain MASE1
LALGGKFQRVNSHLVLRSSLLGGLIFAPHGGMTFAQAVKSDRLRQQTVVNRLFRLLLEGLESTILAAIFYKALIYINFLLLLVFYSNGLKT